MGYMNRKNQMYGRSGGRSTEEVCHDEIKGYPVVNVNVNCGNQPCPEDACDCTESSFRAISQQNQPIINGGQVFYPVVQYDLNDEYDAETSKFIPKQDGIYSFTASLAFVPPRNVTPVNYSADIAIRVNGEYVLAGQSYQGQEFFFTLVKVTAVSGIIQLNAGDEVDVQFFIAPSSLNGFIDPRPWATHFEAARFPFAIDPTINAFKIPASAKPSTKPPFQT